MSGFDCCGQERRGIEEDEKVLRIDIFVSTQEQVITASRRNNKSTKLVDEVTSWVRKLRIIIVVMQSVGCCSCFL